MRLTEPIGKARKNLRITSSVTKLRRVTQEISETYQTAAYVIMNLLIFQDELCSQQVQNGRGYSRTNHLGVATNDLAIYRLSKVISISYCLAGNCRPPPPPPPHLPLPRSLAIYPLGNVTTLTLEITTSE